jgi:hypothetical protein
MCVVHYSMTVGIASVVADVFEPWTREADIDGFNIAVEFAFANTQALSNTCRFVKSRQLWNCR